LVFQSREPLLRFLTSLLGNYDWSFGLDHG